jgi:hypothetical protein
LWLLPFIECRRPTVKSIQWAEQSSNSNTIAAEEIIQQTAMGGSARRADKVAAGARRFYARIVASADLNLSSRKAMPYCTKPCSAGKSNLQTPAS